MIEIQPRRANGYWLNRNPQLFLLNANAVLDYAIQPIIDAHTGDVYGYEALLRNVDQLDCATPMAVFDLAHDLGCLSDLELMLRRKSIEKFASLQERKNARLFLNIDARLLTTPGFLLPETANLLLMHGLTPSSVCLEISEATEPSKIDRIRDFIDDARAMDFAIAIDDFGKGYSHMKNLYDFEPDILKIDRFFIQGLHSDGRKRLLVSSMVDLAHVLGMRVVAEGVETELELSACRQIGCDLIQGYLVSHPFTRIDDAQSRYPQFAAAANQVQSGLKSDEDLILREVRPLVALRDDARMDDVLALLRAGRAYPFIPVVNSADEPRGLIQEADIKSLIYMPFGQDLLRNKAVNNQLKNFLHRCPVADLHSRLDHLVAMIAEDDDKTAGVIITKNGKYYGFLTTSSLFKISNEIRMREAEDQNPLTRLPGNLSLTAFVADAACESETDRCFCYVDFDNFKPFNDIYGFRMGDRALLMFSELIKRMPTSQRDFVGHIGGDDFFIGMRNLPVTEILRIMGNLRSEFRHQAESLYDPEHRQAGVIYAKDRSGQEKEFPLLNCSIAILHLPKGISVENQELLVRQIASLKKDAKASPGGIAATTFGDQVENHARHFEETSPNGPRLVSIGH
ncbi:GGDEF domain-containing protein [Roseibium suaedae]|uniref:Diguanylate cyclase/phosphodiesterase n=1 Tax=Roseibium suaedae TaxID=735517 RepID=A0A1M7N6U3_9HYPH|nr:GGDEF domain-containing protein [Roseibium suaedae]SHM99283.1 diguanylate cyclase/phosphodiesterase [Roseibium suaedae]